MHRRQSAFLLLVLLVFTSSASAGNERSLSSPGQSAPVNGGLPSISGQPFVGTTLTANPGSWKGPTSEYSFQWLRCSSSGDACAAVTGATAQTDLLRSADVGFTMRVAVTASNKNGTSIATSSQIRQVSAPPSPTTNTTSTTTSTSATTTTAPTSTTTPTPTPTPTPTTTTTPTPTTTTTPTPTTTPTTTTTSTTTTTPSSTGSLLFNGDFNTCNLSQWADFHDAHLDRVPPGIQVVNSPAFSGCAAKVVVTGSPDTSVSGDASFLWWCGSYACPVLGNGSDFWTRMQVAFPDGTNAAFPGRWTPSPISAGWDTYLAYHSAPCAGYSTHVGVWGSSPPVLLLRPVGGQSGSQTFNWIRDTQPLQYNHFYDVLLHQKLSPDPAVGYMEWFVDGVLKYAGHLPTLTRCADGSIPSLGFEAGLYRGPSDTVTDTIYIDGVRTGSTRAAVGG